MADPNNVRYVKNLKLKKYYKKDEQCLQFVRPLNLKYINLFKS